MDIREVNSAIIAQVLDSVAVREFIDDRIYPSELAQIQNPTYPVANFLISLSRPIGSASTSLFGLLTVWAWSKEGYDNASQIINTVSAQLEFENFQSNTVNVGLRLLMQPQQLYDDTAQIYGYVTRYNIYALMR